MTKTTTHSDEQPELVQEYRNTIGLFATGVVVLNIEHKGQVRCMTANAVSSLSLEPIQLLVCPSKKPPFPNCCMTVGILPLMYWGSTKKKFLIILPGPKLQP